MIKIKEIELAKKNKLVLSVPQINLESQSKYLILGTNNTGKSIFLSYIHSGECIEIEKKDKKVRSVLIDSQNNLLDDKTVWENLCIGSKKPTATKKSLLKVLCEKAGLGEELQSKASFLCYSHKKLVELIRATAINPRLIIIDDFDKFFDHINLNKAAGILSLATQQGCTIIASAVIKPLEFEKIFTIKKAKLCQEGAQIETQQP